MCGETGIGGCEGDGRWLVFRSWVLSTKAWILDSTVCFICCIISSGLKDALDPVCVDGGATGAGGSDA